MHRAASTSAILSLFLLAGALPVSAAETTSFTLENGLDVTLVPLPAGERVAIVVVFDVGEDHDPEGQSGIGHLIEHCYVTSAAGSTRARTAQAYMQRYPQAWNAQTGARYTVIAVVVPNADLEAELVDAAARMGDLQITQADLDREVPRMRTELANMVDSFSPLAASNRAAEQVRPRPPGGRKGGVIEQIETLDLETVQARHRRLYKPGNARLVLVGPFDAAKARALVETHFGALPKGEAPVLRKPAAPRREKPAETGRRGGWMARAWRATAPDDDAYPAFLLLARRLMAHGMVGSATGTEPRLLFTPLDRPEVVSVVRRVAPEETTAEAAAAIDAWLAEIADEPVGEEEGPLVARDFAFLLGTMPLPDRQVAMNPYGPAFGIARRAQLGLDGAELGRRLARVDQAAFDAMREDVFGESLGATAVVVSPHPAR